MSTLVKCEITVLVLCLIILAVLTPPKPTLPQLNAQEAAAGVLYNIQKLAGKNEAQVETLLGEPVFCANSESTRNCSFRENEIEIVFIDGKADWITVYGTFRSPSEYQKMAGKTKAETLTLLGEPTFCLKAKSSLHCAFRDGDISVEFIDGTVDEVTVKGSLSEAAYSKDTLAMLGLPVKEATFSNKSVMRWDNIPGLLQVTLHSEGSNVSFAAIKAKTR